IQYSELFSFYFFQAEDGIRDRNVTGVQTCALPISYRNKPINQFLDIYFNYIPVLTHEFGHILFNKLSGGRARDLVIVARPAERLATSQQGYAITQSKNSIGQSITTFGGY